VSVLSDVLVKGEYLSDDQIRLLESHISKVKADALSKGIENPSEQMRKLSLNELMRRGALQAAVAKKITEEDPSLGVKAIAFQSLAKQGVLPDFDVVRKALTDEDSSPSGLWRLSRLMGGGQPGPDVDPIIVTFYRTQSTERLVELVDWFSTDGHLAYRALALDRFDVVSANLRADLENGFKYIKEKSIARLRLKFGEQEGNKIAEEWNRLDDFIRSQFTRSALLGLAENAQPSDSALARPYLEHANNLLRDPAVAIISKVGGPEDVSILLKIAKEAYGDVRQEAASAALRLSPKPVEVAHALTESQGAEVVKIAFNWLFGENSGEVKKIFEELIHSQNDTDRVRALHYLSSRMTRKELEQFLKKYLSRETYYYNIVTWLDRLIYSAEPLRQMFTYELEQQAH
jgi:HEAT repeat protein